MARRRDIPPEGPPSDPDDERTRELPRADPYAREGYAEEVYEEALPPPEEPRSWWRENLWVWLLLLLIVVVGGIALVWYLQNDDDGGGDRTVVPAVVGQREAEAVREIRNVGLEPVVQPGPSDRPEGIVFSQVPGGGSQLKEGESVVISVSTGPSTTTVTTTTTTTETVTTPSPPPPPARVVMPDVVGRDQVEAAQTLEGNGLLADSYPVPSDEPAGTVISQRPAAGSELEEGDIVRLNVALGPDEREGSEIPDLTGLEASAARQKARVEGFTVRTVFRSAPSPEEVGEVLTQSPAAGTSAPILTQITLFVGR